MQFSTDFKRQINPHSIKARYTTLNYDTDLHNKVFNTNHDFKKSRPRIYHFVNNSSISRKDQVRGKKYLSWEKMAEGNSCPKLIREIDFMGEWFWDIFWSLWDTKVNFKTTTFSNSRESSRSDPSSRNHEKMFFYLLWMLHQLLRITVRWSRNCDE